jgi:hypothetical protein
MGSFIGGLLTGIMGAYIGYLALLFEADPALLARFQAFNCAAATLVREVPPQGCTAPRQITAPAAPATPAPLPGGIK